MYAEVPFADERGVIVVLVQDLREHDLGRRHTLLVHLPGRGEAGLGLDLELAGVDQPSTRDVLDVVARVELHHLGLEAVAVLDAAGQQPGASRRAGGRRGVALFEDDAVFADLIDVGCLDVVDAIGAHFVRAEIVGDEQDDVRLTLLLDRERGAHEGRLALFHPLVPFDAPLDAGDGTTDENQPKADQEKRTQVAMVHDSASCYPLIGRSRNCKLCAGEKDAFVYSPVMRQAKVFVLVAVLLVPATAWAGNSDEVNAGLDVTLTGGAVVAMTYTGAALWYNPAGIANINKASLELTGITMQIQIVKVPGLLTIDPTLGR